MKLLLTGAFNYSQEQLKRFELLGYEIISVKDELVPINVDVSDIDAVVCNGLFLYNDIKNFKKLKFIQLTSAGLDRIPMDYIKDHGIFLFSADGVYSIPMAEWVILKILEIYKKSKKFYEAQKLHKWEKQRDLLELTDKKAAIIGFGKVGTEIAKRLKAFGVYVLGVGREKKESEFADEFYSIEDIKIVLNKSDIVILTLPLTKKTRNIIDTTMILKMKDDSVLINVSRGGIIDEVALIQAIQTGKFQGVALDVFNEEPLSSESKLWDFDNVYVTPHNSFVSDRVNQRLFELLIKNLTGYIRENGSGGN